MKNIKLKGFKFILILIALFSLVLLGGCANYRYAEDTTEDIVEKEPVVEAVVEVADEEIEEERYPLTITDVEGNEVTITEPVDAIIPFFSSSARTVSILGKENMIIATTERLAKEQTFFPRFAELPSVGNRRAPDVEKITKLSKEYNNLIIIARGGASAKELQQELAGTGVTVINLGLGSPNTVFAGIETLGKILNAEDRASDYITFVNSILQPIGEFVETIPEEDRKTVFFGKLERPLRAERPEEITGWLAIGPGGSSYELIEMAGGRPITEEFPRFTDVSLEWIMAENPEKVVLWALFDSGYISNDPAGLMRMNKLFSNAPGLAQIEAVKNADISVVAVEIAASPHFIVTLVALVEQWYPEAFKFCYVEVHQEIIDRFHNIDFNVETQGAFVYQGGK